MSAAEFPRTPAVDPAQVSPSAAEARRASMTASVPTGSPRSSDIGWQPVSKGREATYRGLIGKVRQVSADPARLGLLRSAIRGAVGDDVDLPLGLPDLCPDPLDFALSAGLPRPSFGTRFIDGGSSWHEVIPVPEEVLTAIPRIADLDERALPDGRRMHRIRYAVEFRTRRGALVGSAVGSSLDVEDR